jgi:hypothetical protein
MQVLPAPGTRERPPHERARGGRAGAHRVADPGLQRPSHERHCHAPVETGHLRTEGAQVLGWGTRLACVSMLLFTAGLEGALVRYGSQRGGAHPLIPQYVREAVPRGAVRVHWAVLQPDLHGIKRVAAAAQTPSQSAQSGGEICLNRQEPTSWLASARLHCRRWRPRRSSVPTRPPDHACPGSGRRCGGPPPGRRQCAPQA